jgi:hypothetical protein
VGTASRWGRGASHAGGLWSPWGLVSWSWTLPIIGGPRAGQHGAPSPPCHFTLLERHATHGHKSQEQKLLLPPKAGPSGYYTISLVLSNPTKLDVRESCIVHLLDPIIIMLV